jgi:hypothetical protein
MMEDSMRPEAMGPLAEDGRQPKPFKLGVFLFGKKVGHLIYTGTAVKIRVNNCRNIILFHGYAE